jgi:NAD(P)-dependent dehydrogenase (short-subunit alcohol dehydrogenase family)
MVNKTILVTGANRGIGLAICEALVKQPHTTVLMGMREPNMQPLSAQSHVVKLDLTTREGLQNDLAAIIRQFGPIDGLINNAGVLHEGTIFDIKLADYDHSLRVNATAPLELIHSLLPSMIKRQYGRIVNISSGWGSFDEGLTGPISYSISKATMNALTKNISKDLPKNVLINSMCPGWVKTRMGGSNAPRTPAEGAQTAVWLVNLPAAGPSGEFFRDQKNIGW